MTLSAKLAVKLVDAAKVMSNFYEFKIMSDRNRLATWCLALCILLNSVVLPAQASPKSGSSCKSQGQIRIYQGKKFQCIKSNRKLIWGKGVIIPKVPNIFQPIIKPELPTGPASRISLDNLDPNWTASIAFAEVRNKVQPFDSTSLKIRFIVGPGVKSDRVSAEKSGIDRIAGLWIKDFTPSQTRFVYVSETDSIWAEQIVLTEKLNPMLYQSITLMITQNSCGFALGSYFDNIYTNIQCLGAGQEMGSLQTGPHEYTHFYQYANNRIPDYAPCWITEGMAHFYGEAIGYSHLDNKREVGLRMYQGQTYNYDRSKGITIESRTLPKLLMENSAEKVINFFKTLEVPGGGGHPSACYLFGGVAFEALVASFGHDKIVEFMKAFNTSRDWKANFLQVFEVDNQTFYRKLTPYLAYIGKQIY